MGGFVLRSVATLSHVRFQPLAQRRQAHWRDAIDTLASLCRRRNETRGLKPFQMLDDGGTRHRHAARKVAGAHRCTGQTLENHNPQRVT